MTDPLADTIGHYNRHAAEFAVQTANVDMEPNYRHFLPRVWTRGCVLDAGCGVGRDTFVLADRGDDVVAIDASEDMVRLARERVGERAAVHLRQLLDVPWRDEFDGIWACASLPHVPAASFGHLATRLAAALRPAGSWYMSFKMGSDERASGGRLFVDHDQETLRPSLEATPVDIIETWVSLDASPERSKERWLNVIAQRASG
jgi:SAM-dependent methyltransferase